MNEELYLDLKQAVRSVEDRLTKLEIKLSLNKFDHSETNKVKDDRVLRNKEDINSLRNENFDSFWSVYPHRFGRKLNKKSAMRSFRGIDKHEIEDVIKGAKNYANSIDATYLEFTQDPSKWLTEENWRAFIQDEDENN